MNALSLVPMFMVGLAGSVHCIGMCGGIVGALSLSGGAPTAPVRPVISIAVARPAMQTALPSNVLRVLAYNAGRIGSYMLAGALAGGLAGAGMLHMASLQVAGYWLANLMLVALGLYLMDAWRGLAHLEAAGNVVWRRVRPLLKPLLPMDSAFQGAGRGRAVGLAAVRHGLQRAADGHAERFGPRRRGHHGGLRPGHLAHAAGHGLAGHAPARAMQRRPVRIASGLLVLGFGLLGLAARR